jgi:hypothetical protein
VPESKKRKRPERLAPSSAARGAQPVRRRAPVPAGWPRSCSSCSASACCGWSSSTSPRAHGRLPGVSEIGNWNLLVGFGFIIAGFGLSTQWR